jgi:hypothetical protein
MTEVDLRELRCHGAIVHGGAVLLLCLVWQDYTCSLKSSSAAESRMFAVCRLLQTTNLRNWSPILKDFHSATMVVPNGGTIWASQYGKFREAFDARDLLWIVLGAKSNLTLTSGL